jgi:ADP-ribose pyrophosphatase YjhB (NUDIX family)
MVPCVGFLDGWRFCPICGEAIEKIEDRAECRSCGYVSYANPAPAAEAVCFGDDGRILLGRRAVDPGKDLWDLPGGFLHEHEHPLDALRRELREETGLELREVRFLGFWLEPYDGRIVLSLTFTARVSGDPRAADDLSELAWFGPDEVPSASELAFTHYPAALSAAFAQRDEDA